MAKLHNDFVKHIDEWGHKPAMSWLLKQTGMDTGKAQEIMKEVNYYPDPKEFEQALSIAKVERSVNDQLNKFFFG